MRTRQCYALVAVLVITVGVRRAAAQHLYWTSADGTPALDDGVVKRAMLESPVIETVVSGLLPPRGVAVDPVGGKIYWGAADGGTDGFIFRANLDGSNVQSIVSLGDTPSHVQIDPYGRKVYWTELVGSGRIHRADLDGQNHQLLNFTEATSGFTLHLPTSTMYWLAHHCEGPCDNFGDICICSRTLWRANLSGSNPQQVTVEVLSEVVDFEPFFQYGDVIADPVHGQLYFLIEDTIFRSDLNDTLREPIVTGLQQPPDSSSTGGLAIDPFEGHLYWYEDDPVNKFSRADLDGQNVEPFLTETMPNIQAMAVNPSVDCNENLIEDICEVNCGPPGGPCNVAGCGTHSDTDRDGVLDICEDCDDNGIPDPCDLSCASAGCNVPGCGTGTDCDGDTVLDSCQSADDCNENSVNDICDLESGTSLDCNSNSVPDECDVASATSLDCNSNGVPDECDPDCNENTIPDDCDITGSTSLDCNDNSIPDECDIVQFDCNDNGIPDDCDIANATSTDSDENGIPDECCPPPCEPEPLLANTFGTCTTGNANCVVGGPACASGTCDTCGQVRYISFGIPGSAAGANTAIRVKLTSLYDVAPPLPTSGVSPGPALAAFEGEYRYLNTIPGTFSRCCNPASNPTACNPSVTCNSDADCVGLGLNTECEKNLCPDSPSFNTYFRCARLGCTPEYRDWGSDFSGLITYATGDSVVPDSTYHASLLAASCAGNEPSCLAASAELMIKTERWGNMDCTGAGTTGNVVPSASDIGFVVVKAGDKPFAALIKPRAQLREASPNSFALVSAQDVGRVVDACKGRHYPDSFTISTCP